MVMSSREASLENSGHDLSTLRRPNATKHLDALKASQLRTTSNRSCALMIDPVARSSARHSRPSLFARLPHFPEFPEEPKEKKMSAPFIGLVQGKTLPRFHSEEFAQSE